MNTDTYAPSPLDVAILLSNPTCADRIPLEQRCRRVLEEYGVPESLRGGLIRYLLGGIIPGGFLTAVLTNDLRTAVTLASPVEHLLALPAIVRFLHNEAPSTCAGSPELVGAWIVTRHQERRATT